MKADAYGHGALDCARAALDAGATALCVAALAEAPWQRLAWLDLAVNEVGAFGVPALLAAAWLDRLGALDLRNNHLTNLILPAGLEGLTSLSLGANRLHDLPFLAEFKNLETLDL